MGMTGGPVDRLCRPTSRGSHILWSPDCPRLDAPAMPGRRDQPARELREGEGNLAATGEDAVVAVDAVGEGH
jgi:hypothetical protein